MTREEHRAKCIEAMARAMMKDMFAPHELKSGLEYAELLHRYLITASGAFDSLHGIALVFPEVPGDVAEYCFTREQTLTDPPEGKP